MKVGQTVCQSEKGGLFLLLPPKIYDWILHYLCILSGLVLFLEEDHYVAEDFLHVLKLLEAERIQKYSNCDIICLGTYLKSYNYNRNHKNVSTQLFHHVLFHRMMNFPSSSPLFGNEWCFIHHSSWRMKIHSLWMIMKESFIHSLCKPWMSWLWMGMSRTLLFAARIITT